MDVFGAMRAVVCEAARVEVRTPAPVPRADGDPSPSRPAVAGVWRAGGWRRPAWSLRGGSTDPHCA